MQKTLQRCQTFGNSAFDFAGSGIKSKHPCKKSTDNSYTKWFIENQDTAYRLGKLHKWLYIVCLLTKFQYFFLMLDYFLIVF